MEIGRVAEIDNAKTNNVEKLTKISNLDQKNKIIAEEEYKKALSPDATASKNEVILDNVKFGYNKDSKDFFVKITKSEAEYKYPTEDMMNKKAYFLQELELRND